MVKKKKKRLLFHSVLIQHSLTKKSWFKITTNISLQQQKSKIKFWNHIPIVFLLKLFGKKKWCFSLKCSNFIFIVFCDRKKKIILQNAHSIRCNFCAFVEYVIYSITEKFLGLQLYSCICIHLIPHHSDAYEFMFPSCHLGNHRPYIHPGLLHKVI